MLLMNMMVRELGLSNSLILELGWAPITFWDLVKLRIKGVSAVIFAKPQRFFGFRTNHGTATYPEPLCGPQNVFDPSLGHHHVYVSRGGWGPYILTAVFQPDDYKLNPYVERFTNAYLRKLKAFHICKTGTAKKAELWLQISGSYNYDESVLVKDLLQDLE